MSTEAAPGGTPKNGQSAPVPLAPEKDVKSNTPNAPAAGSAVSIDAKSPFQAANQLQMFGRDGKSYARIKNISHTPQRQWIARLPEAQCKSLPNINDLCNKAFANVDAKNPVPSFTLNGNPSLEAGVPHFDVTVQISTTPAIKFVLNFVREDYQLEDGSFQHTVAGGRKWVKVGTIDDFDKLLKEYPVTDYEWGGTANHVIPQPLVILTWTKGHRVGFQHPYPQGDSFQKFAVGTTFWTRGLADNAAESNGKDGRFKHGYYHVQVDPKTGEQSYVLAQSNGLGGLIIFVRRY